MGKKTLARVTAGVAMSHVPAIGAAVDLGKTGEPYWKPMFAGFEFSKEWIANEKPDVVFLVYNDHATAFGLDNIPTFAIGCADEFEIADEGWGGRSVIETNVEATKSQPSTNIVVFDGQDHPRTLRMIGVPRKTK